MPELIIWDTFPEFLEFWEQYQSKPIKLQIELWAKEYLKNYQDLLLKLQNNYKENRLSWNKIAKKKIFPYIATRIPIMREAHKNLLEGIKLIFGQARIKLNLDFDIIFLIYIGIGIGAGWATIFRGKRACLYGLENIAELKWKDINILKALTAHEIGHLIHYEWRERKGLSLNLSSSILQLYEEGFAQRCEHIIMEKDTFHINTNDKSWLTWCNSNKAYLASRYLNSIYNEKPHYNFFGSWSNLNIRGHQYTGYFLGHELIQEWEKLRNIEEIALLPLDSIKDMTIKTLKDWL